MEAYFDALETYAEDRAGFGLPQPCSTDRVLPRNVADLPFISRTFAWNFLYSYSLGVHRIQR